MKARGNDWQSRRATLLQAACNEVAAAVAGGAPLLSTVKRIARRYHGRSLRGRRLKCSAKTLLKLWYRWQEARTPAAFSLGYKSAGVQFARGPMLRVAAACLKRSEGATAAWRRLRAKGIDCSRRTFLRAVPARKMARIIRLQSRLDRERAAVLSEIAESLASLRGKETRKE